ncbi:OprO/OprP family phosphate-selective porin [Pseudomarimonas arenosa]|uniref:Porin n=1 Tax=Pseudomarimonas arenosa TaxID=2774145 RepID=A0AAW3ZUJ7_9GAMM|nr:porin [Pseudomarimonas arenosa]MBD8527726.1 porin [Pseudomarimonas arenosa]
MKIKQLTAMLAAVLATSAARAEISLTEVGGFKLGLEGLLQADGNWFDNDRVDLNGAGSGNGDDSEFGVRRAEVALKAKGERLDWVLAYDFEAEKWLDANFKWKLDFAAITIGQYKQPMGLEELSSTKYNDFISKSLATNLFAPSRRLGVGLSRDYADWGYQLSAFSRELTRDRARGSGFAGRAYWRPLISEQAYLHLGLSAISRDTDADTERLRARPGADLATVRLIDSGTLTNTDALNGYGLEGLWVQGPWKLQTEFLSGTIDRYDAPGVEGADYDADAWYVSGVWNITGEGWGYKAGTPTPSTHDNALGVWQVGLRYDAADLDDGAVRGGDAEHVTLGVNWYWRKNFRLSLNYVDVQSDRRGVSDDPSITEARIQLYW